MFLSQIPNLFFCGIFEHNFFASVKEIHKLRFLSTTTSAEKILVPQHIDHLKTEHYQGSADRGEVNIGSYINCLASGVLGNPLLYPVSVGYFPGTERGILFISIVDRILRRALVFFSLLYAINYHYNKGTLKVEFIK